MAENLKKVAQITLTGPGTQDTLYTVPSGLETAIKHIRIVNILGSGVGVQIWHDGVASSNKILPNVTIGSGEWSEFDGNILMEAFDTLHAEASSSNGATITVYGVEFV